MNETDYQFSQKEFCLNETNYYNPSISHVSFVSSSIKNNNSNNNIFNVNSFNSNSKGINKKLIKETNDLYDSTKNSEKGINKFTGSPTYIK